MEDVLWEILNKMNGIEYGFIDNDGNKYLANKDNYGLVFPSKYRLQINNELNYSKIGVCWDSVELERYYLEKENIKCDSYCIVCFDNDMDPTHTFIVVNDNDKYYLLENLGDEFRGVYKYENINNLFLDVLNRFCENMIDKENVKIYKYDKPLYNYSCMEFYEYIKKGIVVNI